jgi:hypothetical protein
MQRNSDTPISAVETDSVFLALRMLKGFEEEDRPKWTYELGHEEGALDDHAIDHATELLVMWGWVNVLSGPAPGLGHCIEPTSKGLTALALR